MSLFFFSMYPSQNVIKATKCDGIFFFSLLPCREFLLFHHFGKCCLLTILLGDSGNSIELDVICYYKFIQGNYLFNCYYCLSKTWNLELNMNVDPAGKHFILMKIRCEQQINQLDVILQSDVKLSFIYKILPKAAVRNDFFL